MRKVGIVGSIAMLLLASQANAAYVYFENFESGATGWTTWTQNGTSTKSTVEAENQTTAVPPTYPLGDIQPESGSNLQSYHLEGTIGNGSYNGGIWKQITVPADIPLTVDGFWRSHVFKRNNQWTEVIVWNKAMSLVNTSDYNPGVNGNFGDGETVYKVYTNDIGTSPGYAGQISNTTLPSPIAYAFNYATGVGGQTWASSPLVSSTGVITVLLKFGHTSSSAKSFDWDDIYVTPEPAALALLALGVPLLLRRRRT